jgi:sulfonate transport system substrate-binding protein
MSTDRKSFAPVRAALQAMALFIVTTLGIAGANAQETVRIGYLNQIHDAAIMAIENELGSKYKIEMVKFLRYADTELALIRGDLDVATIGYTNGIIAAGREATPSFTFVSGLSRGAINVVCHKDIKVDSWSDLKGKKFGLLVGGTAELFFDDALSLHSVNRKDIPAVSFTAPGPPLLQALQNKDIDCTAVFEPFAANAVATGYGYYPAAIDLSQNSFRGVNSAWAVNNNFLKKNPGFVKDAVPVIVKASEYYTANKDKLQTDFTKRLEFKPEVIKIGADRIILDSNLYLESAVKTAESMKRLGFIKEVPDRKKLAAYYDYSFLTGATGKSADDVGQNK